MDKIGYLTEDDGRFEYRMDGLGLIVRGNYAEWVLQAAAEIISKTARAEAEGRLEEISALMEFGEATEMDLDATKFDMKARFEILPQCIVSMGSMEYRWAAPEAREKLADEFDGHAMRRIHDMSMTRNDTFLANEDGVDMGTE